LGTLAQILQCENVFKTPKIIYKTENRKLFFKTFFRVDISFKPPYPGFNPLPIEDDHIEKAHQLLYQWILLIQIAQVLLFRVPRGVWKYFENNSIRNLVEGNNSLLK
jgi:hypothetical protein